MAITTKTTKTSKIFVGNLSWSTTEDELRDHFAQFGNVLSVKIVTEGGKSKGFGFIEMEKAEDAQAAIDKLNDQPLGNRNLRVSQAVERRSDKKDFGGHGHQDSYGSRHGRGPRQR